MSATQPEKSFIALVAQPNLAGSLSSRLTLPLGEAKISLYAVKDVNELSAAVESPYCVGIFLDENFNSDLAVMLENIQVITELRVSVILGSKYSANAQIVKDSKLDSFDLSDPGLATRLLAAGKQYLESANVDSRVATKKIVPSSAYIKRRPDWGPAIQKCLAATPEGLDKLRNDARTVLKVLASAESVGFVAFFTMQPKPGDLVVGGGAESAEIGYILSSEPGPNEGQVFKTSDWPELLAAKESKAAVLWQGPGLTAKAPKRYSAALPMDAKSEYLVAYFLSEPGAKQLEYLEDLAAAALELSKTAGMLAYFLRIYGRFKGDSPFRLKGSQLNM